MIYNLGLVWLRRDLRLNDNAALYHALQNCKYIICVFIFDTNILSNLDKDDKRITFIYQSLQEIQQNLRKINKKLIILYGTPLDIIPKLAKEFKVDAVFINHDYEEYAIQRDNNIQKSLAKNNVNFYTYKDQVIFEKQEILSKQQKIYTVFTPYKKTWIQNFSSYELANYRINKCDLEKKYIDANIINEKLDKLHTNFKSVNSIEDSMFVPQNILIKGGEKFAQQYFTKFLEHINSYHNLRDFPALEGCSYLSTHLRFGTLSIRQLVYTAYRLTLTNNLGADHWLKELIWREFFMQILANFPHIQQGKCFNSKYDNLLWQDDEKAKEEFEIWCNGETGYPIVDAAMRQLNQTGYMNNRLRMISASFLIKNMGINWQWGEAYFAKKLLDFDFASNNGNWQWCASTGCDAQPYFRIFNPITQSKKFDPQEKFIKNYIPELKNLPSKYIHNPWQAPLNILEQSGIKLGKDYPLPIIDYKNSRKETLLRYKLNK